MSHQAYRIKTIRFRGQECCILLQNENGPCPLLAAANALLLQQKVKLPASAIRNNVATLSDLTNVLANFALQASPAAEESQFYFDELFRQIPKLQDGMDVNPKFTSGIMGYEFTPQLTCFDLWHVKLVHGWLLDPAEATEEVFDAIGNKTYNELIEIIVQGREAEAKQLTIQSRLDELRVAAASHPPSVDLLDGQVPPAAPEPGSLADPSVVREIADLEEQLEVCQKEVTRASFIDHFLLTTGHQLTQYGLAALHEVLQESEVTVFFRNNHFATLTKHEGSLFLLVTDLGYANTPMVVWERLDVIDGDTEYVSSMFKTPGQITQIGTSLTPEQLLAQSSQNDADYHLALALSAQPSDAKVNLTSQSLLDSAEGKLMAAATEASLREFHGQSAATTVPHVKNGGDGVAYTIVDGQRIEVGVPAGNPLLKAPPLPLQQPFSVGGGDGQTNLPGTTGTSPTPTPQTSYASAQEAADALLARQLANEMEQQDQTRRHDEDWHLARQLQDEEEQRAAMQRQANPQQPQPPPQQHRQTQQQQPAATSPRNQKQGGASGDGKCVIS